MKSSNCASIFTFMLIALLCNMMVTSTALPTKADYVPSNTFLAPQYDYSNYIPSNVYSPFGYNEYPSSSVDPNESTNLHHVYAPSSLGEYAVEADYSRTSRTKADYVPSNTFLAPQYDYSNYIPSNVYSPFGYNLYPSSLVDPNESTNLHHVYAPSTLGEYAVEADYSRTSRATVIILPSDKECLTAETDANGGRACKAASQERTGTIDIKLGVADQSANVAITAPSATTRIRLSCTEMIAAAAFTQNGKINAPSDTPRFERGFLNLVVVSTAANARVKCSWRI
ncbi:hypothetical protein GHT06_011217 [Daphnia sinensis]|uniref:Uncharacterized protein n=1 Tax=Daphnia sinensis TaxID=1820382 RepID=A0AAD5LK29_9CRUS|nr:hypothetical protein GHT06_011217 [Daphnia sinensis]